MDTRDRYRGALVGLAVCDALGTTVEFQAPGTFKPLTDVVGGGPFRLKPGQWTDDTSLALCLAVNLGDDADTTGAVYGQIAGAFYGHDGIPERWRNVIAKRELILRLADGLFSGSHLTPRAP
jgi:ADP-ribosylglycohydrolase